LPPTHSGRVRLVAATLVLAVGAIGWVAAPPPGATVAWAPAGSAPVHPGVPLLNVGAQCTAGFVVVDSGHIFLEEAAHCLSIGTPRGAEGDGCTAESLPLGTPVDIAGAAHRGTLAYSAWIAMRLAREADPDLCAFNDLALVALDLPALRHEVSGRAPLGGHELRVEEAPLVVLPRRRGGGGRKK